MDTTTMDPPQRPAAFTPDQAPFLGTGTERPGWNLDVERRVDDGRTLANLLGWFSLGLGAVELLAPDRLERWLGVEGREALVQAYGLREIGTGIGILANHRPAGWLEICPLGYGSGFTRLYWLRTAGDAVYHSASYSAAWDANGTPLHEPQYHVVTEPQTEPRRAEAWSGSVRVDLVVQDDGVTYASAGTATLQPYEDVADYGSGCDTGDYGYVLITRCWASRTWHTGVLGSAPLHGVF